MIDTHHHFWNFTKEEFGWIEDDSIRKSFNAPELEQTLSSSPVTAAVSVQARCCLEENDYLLAQSEGNDFIAGVVGWVDLSSASLAEQLENAAQHPKFVGVREIIQGTADEQFLGNHQFNRGVAKLAASNLTFDLLLFDHQLRSGIDFVSRHPGLPIVLDHCGKPPISENYFPSAWKADIRALSKHENAFCKLSGLTTEIKDGTRPSPSLFQPYFETVLEAFGPNRLMFGSDWPVSLSQAPYRDWIEIVEELTSGLTASEQDAIFRTTAQSFYGF